MGRQRERKSLDWTGYFVVESFMSQWRVLLLFFCCMVIFVRYDVFLYMFCMFCFYLFEFQLFLFIFDILILGFAYLSIPEFINALSKNFHSNCGTFLTKKESKLLQHMQYLLGPIKDPNKPASDNISKAYFHQQIEMPFLNIAISVPKKLLGRSNIFRFKRKYILNLVHLNNF